MARLVSVSVASFFALSLLLAPSTLALRSYLHPDAQVHEFVQRVDHFGYTTNATFVQRVIIHDGHWRSDGDPIFFYAGNEDDIFMFANHTGFIWDISEEFSALVVFAEHRYYGKSLPFGKESFSSPRKFGYLSISQALADFAADIQWIKASYNGTNSPVILFGGSYGGMLAVYMRQKYPHLVAGALASSAPIWTFPSMYNCTRFNQVVTSDFANYNSTCVDAVKQSWPALRRIASTSEGLQWIESTFHLCPIDPPNTLDIDFFFSWISVIYSILAMTDYPMESAFIKEKPPYPIGEFCRQMPSSRVDDKELIGAIYRGLSRSYLNYTGKSKCNVLNEDQDAAWTIQSCTEIVTPICNSHLDMFEPSPSEGQFNLTEYADSCKYYYGVEPNLEYVEAELVGQDLSSLSNVIFSNGLRDPWSTGGVLESNNDKIDVLVMQNACHHEDLKGSHPLDTAEVIETRRQEKKIIKRWMKEHRERGEKKKINANACGDKDGQGTTTTTTTTTTATTTATVTTLAATTTETTTPTPTTTTTAATTTSTTASSTSTTNVNSTSERPTEGNEFVDQDHTIQQEQQQTVE